MARPLALAPPRCLLNKGFAPRRRIPSCIAPPALLTSHPHPRPTPPNPQTPKTPPTPRRSVCEEQRHWRELSHLYVAYDEYDNAATCMMGHPTVAWDHVAFKDVIAKVSNADLYYKALSFYLQARVRGGMGGGMMGV